MSNGHKAGKPESELHDCGFDFFWQFVWSPMVPFFYRPSVREWGTAQIETEKIDDRWHEDVALMVAKHCPWCGIELPPSLRAERDAKLAELGLDPSVDEIPEPFNSHHWWSEST